MKAKILLQDVHDEYWDNLTIVDLSEFKAVNVYPKVHSLQSEITKKLAFFTLDKKCLKFNKKEINSAIILNLSGLEFYDGIAYISYESTENNILPSSKYSISDILVSYDDFFEYGEFDEYNINADIINFHELSNMEECLSEKICTYITCYGFSIILTVFLEEIL